LKKLAAILLFCYYAFGTLCLPLGDFSVARDLPEMYAHCKSTEDKDMTAIDFITDHLMNIDCIFDRHDDGDDQKPHTPVQLHHSQAQITFITQLVKINFINPSEEHFKLPLFSEGIYISGYISEIFHPPIA
jgi:hypothetical protein